jgi:hypothetical protein
MITDEQILQIAREHLYVLTSVNEWCGEEGDLLNFAQQIRKETINEILSDLKNVPNPEANRTAINRIETELN